ncbi:uroporphyrinogen-III synthase [Acetobacter estunensis NRIC 0472]|uniref:Uroporphyrinogen-III synthase n=1 Tax=Acetobacter estunensis TaxID=104097 RepID=A0A967B792_9PROT|nr:uroporphyrinogen-III synthase [Acetobacter estunensis]NHO54178.1 uroporphyrinogen-III synthase [Acetobacter estunensis]GBQ21426.1 uroporphyrinogen-III synthase [Acetobacter estunensis NRIC 0472]
MTEQDGAAHNRKPGVLIVRPEPGLSETVEAARTLGWEPFAASSLHIEPRFVPQQSGVAAALVTSSQSLPALEQAVARDLPIFAVGDATSRRARERGFTHVESASGNAGDLAALVRARLTPENGTLLLLSGKGHGAALAAELRTNGFRVRRRVAYASRPQHDLPSPVLRAWQQGEISLVLSFSAGSARTLCRALRSTDCVIRNMPAIAISAATARVLEHNGFRPVRTAAHPDAANMLRLLGAASAAVSSG